MKKGGVTSAAPQPAQVAVPPAKWSIERFITELPVDSAPEQLTALDLKNRNILSLPPQLTFLSRLRKIDLSKNALAVLPELHKIPTLSQINVSNNQLTSVAGLRQLKSIVVLNISYNKIESLSGVEGSGATLKALVANNNSLSFATRGALDALRSLVAVETIVLSRNPLMTQSSAASASSEEHHPLEVFAQLEKLQKLSLSECGLRSLPNDWYLPRVSELRLAKNFISAFGDRVLVKSLKILDISSNEFESLESLARHAFLTQLNVHGNPVVARFAKMYNGAQAAVNADDGFRALLGRFKLLQMVDGAPFAHGSADDQRRRRRDALLERQMAGDGAGEGGSDDDDDDDDNGEEATEVLPRSKKRAEGAAQSTKGSRREMTAAAAPPPLAEDVEYTLPAEIASKSSKIVVKREKVYTAPASNSKEVVATGGDVLAQLRASKSAKW